MKGFSAYQPLEEKSWVLCLAFTHDSTSPPAGSTTDVLCCLWRELTPGKEGLSKQEMCWVVKCVDSLCVGRSAPMRAQSTLSVLSGQEVLSGGAGGRHSCLWHWNVVLIRRLGVEVKLRGGFVSITLMSLAFVLDFKKVAFLIQIQHPLPSFCCKHAWLFKRFTLHSLIYLPAPPFISNLAALFILPSATPISRSPQFPSPLFFYLSPSLFPVMSPMRSGVCVIKMHTIHLGGREAP